MDPIIGGSLITGGGSLVSSAMNFLGQREQRSWEERMANTAYRRSSADMRAAGLNPALMYGSGGAAATPNIAPPKMENPLAGMGEAVMNRGRLALETQKVANETRVADSQVDKTRAEIVDLLVKPGLTRSHIAGSDAATVETQTRTATEEQRRRNLIAELEAIRAQTRERTASARHLESGLPKAEGVAQLWQELMKAGKGAPPFESHVQGILDKLLGPPGSVNEEWEYWKGKRPLIRRGDDAARPPGSVGGGGSARDISGDVPGRR